MTKDEVLNRIAILSDAINKSVANHNALVGALEENKLYLTKIEEEEAKVISEA